MGMELLSTAFGVGLRGTGRWGPGEGTKHRLRVR